VEVLDRVTDVGNSWGRAARAKRHVRGSGMRGADRIVLTRGLRGFADGLVSVALAGHLLGLGFTSLQVGAIVTGTLLGSASLTIALGLTAHRFDLRGVLLAASALMLATGLAFAGLEGFWPLLVVAVVGTLNPSAGDVSVFLPTEQALLAHVTPDGDRTTLFARYNVAGTLAGGLGALAAGLPALLGQGERSAFLLYAGIALVVAVVYGGLPASPASSAPRASRPLARSRRVVVRLAMLFSLDAFGGALVVQSLLVLWLTRRFGLSAQAMGAIFFAVGLLGALSQLVSPRLVSRIGFVRTMVYTHLPANLFLVLAGVAPTAPLAVGFLLARALLSQMDVPARQAYVMAIVPPEERAAAASVTNVPRSLSAALPPLLTGLMLDRSTFGWPLVCAGVLKALYDVLLLAQFRSAPSRVAS